MYGLVVNVIFSANFIISLLEASLQTCTWSVIA